MYSILLIGRPGGGKGTQADLLKERLDFEIITTGDLLREKGKENDFTGKKLKIAMDTGNLMPTVVVSATWFKKLEDLKNSDNKKSIVFDGFARKLIEAELLFQALDWFELGGVFKVIYIDISAKESANRIRKRKMCDKCKTIFMGDYQGDKCDKCNDNLIIRGDQTEEAIKKREQQFIKETMPVLDYFKERGVFRTVNGEQPVEDVYNEIIKTLD